MLTPSAVTLHSIDTILSKIFSLALCRNWSRMRDFLLAIQSLWLRYHGWVTVTTNRSYHQPRWRRPKTVRPNYRGYQVTYKRDTLCTRDKALTWFIMRVIFHINLLPCGLSYNYIARRGFGDALICYSGNRAIEQTRDWTLTWEAPVLMRFHCDYASSILLRLTTDYQYVSIYAIQHDITYNITMISPLARIYNALFQPWFLSRLVGAVGKRMIMWVQGDCCHSASGFRAQSSSKPSQIFRRFQVHPVASKQLFTEFLCFNSQKHNAK